jgi:hypothetical protein
LAAWSRGALSVNSENTWKKFPNIAQAIHLLDQHRHEELLCISEPFHFVPLKADERFADV